MSASAAASLLIDSDRPTSILEYSRCSKNDIVGLTLSCHQLSYTVMVPKPFRKGCEKVRKLILRDVR